jgi:hypothetical protein
MPEQLVITAAQDMLQELARELQDDTDVDPGEVEYEGPKLPGQAGEPVTIAILILVGKGMLGGGGAWAGQKMAAAVWKRLSSWHSRHPNEPKFACRDESGTDRALTWDEIQRAYGPPAAD